MIKNTLGDCMYNMNLPATLYDYMKMVELSEMMGYYKNALHCYYYNHLSAFKYRKGSEITVSIFS